MAWLVKVLPSQYANSKFLPCIKSMERKKHLFLCTFNRVTGFETNKTSLRPVIKPVLNPKNRVCNRFWIRKHGFVTGYKTGVLTGTMGV